MNTVIFNGKASMTSVEIAELVGSQHSDVKRSIERLVAKSIIRKPPMAVSEKINKLGFKVQHEHYLFEGEQGKRDSIIVVAQLCPEFTDCLVDRWHELEKQIRKPMSQIEMVAAMALEAVRQQRRLEQVEEKVTYVTETVERIKRGTIRDGYAGYRQLVAKTGMSDAKCRNLVNAYQIPTDPHEFMRPDGLLSRRAIVAVEPFMAAFYRVMEEAEPRGTRWYYPKMGVFQVIGWQK
ncbi:DNA-binding protein [Escherichia coli]|nr:DNA-binding protein [Escherichia coli]